MVVVKSRRYPEVGAFVTGLCGVDAPEGMVWTFTIDSEWSKVGIGNLTLEKDTLIEWETRGDPRPRSSWCETDVRAPRHGL